MITKEQIIHELMLRANAERREKAKTYYPTRLVVLGVSNPDIQQVIKLVKAEMKNASVQECVQLAKELAGSGIHEAQHLGIRWLGYDKTLIASITESDIDELAVGLDNWVSVDNFSILISGAAWLRGTIGIEKIRSYLASDDPFIRRVAVVSTVTLNLKSRGGKGDVEQTLDICRRVVSDHHPMLIKALSWALRELSKCYPAPVIEFIDTYKKILSPRVTKEVTHKVLHGTKN